MRIRCIKVHLVLVRVRKRGTGGDISQRNAGWKDDVQQMNSGEAQLGPLEPNLSLSHYQFLFPDPPIGFFRTGSSVCET